MMTTIACLLTRRRLADYLSGQLAAGSRQRVTQHIASCERCAARVDQLQSVIGILGDAACVAVPDRLQPRLAAFEQRVLAIGRERGRLSRGEVSPAASMWSRPVPAAAALGAGLILAAGIIGISISGWPGNDPGGGLPASQTASLSQEAILFPESILLDDESGPADWIRSPEEIPVVVYEDLVGERRARIPAVTYVMEPAPGNEGIVRASF